MTEDKFTIEGNEKSGILVKELKLTEQMRR